MDLAAAGADLAVAADLASATSTDDGGAPDLSGANSPDDAGQSADDAAVDRVPGPPALLQVSPADTATGVGITSDVVLTFSEPMDQASVAAAFTSAPPLGCTFGTSGAVVTCTHAAMAYNTMYSLGLGVGATSLRGPALAASAAWSFTTAAEPAPVVSSITIEGYGASKQVPFSTGAITIDISGSFLDGISAASFVSEVPADMFGGPITATVSPGGTSTAIVLMLTVPDADNYPFFGSTDNPHVMDLHLTSSHGSTVTTNALVLTSITAGPSGSDTTGKGTPDSPFRSLAHCLGRVHGPDTVHLQAGTYNENNGESWLSATAIVSNTFSTMPGPIRILGDGVGTTVVTTTQANKVAMFVGSAAGNPSVRLEGFTLQGFYTAISWSSGSLDLRANVSNDTHAGVVVGGSATLQVDGAEISGNGTGCCGGTAALYSGIYAIGSSTVSMSSANLHDNAAAGLYLKDTVTANLGNACKFNRTNYNPANGAALYSLPSTLGAGLVIDGGTSVTGGGGEIAHNNQYGVLVNSGTAPVSLGVNGNGYQIHDNQSYGLVVNYSGAATFILRKSQVTGHALGGAGAAGGIINLGFCVNSLDPGNNTFSGNAASSGYDLVVQGGTVYSCGTALAGNTGAAADPFPNHASATTITNPSNPVNDGNHRWSVSAGNSLIFNQL